MVVLSREVGGERERTAAEHQEYNDGAEFLVNNSFARGGLY